jgi:hypothetical protein
MKTFVDLVKEYSSWKLQEKGNGKLSRSELTKLREAYKAKAGTTAALRETVTQYKAWKLQKYGTDKLTEKEVAALKATAKKVPLKEKKELKENNWETYLSNYKKFKESKEGAGAKISYKELKILKENFKEASEKKVHLQEADAGFDPAGAAPAPGDPNAMGADPLAAGGAPAAPVDPTLAAGLQDAFQSLKTALDSAGVPTDNPLGADPNAGIPPVDGMQADPAGGGIDPNAAPLAEAIKQYSQWKKANKGSEKLTEGEVKALTEKFSQAKPKSKYQQIQERIAARQAKIASLQEKSSAELAADLKVPCSVKEFGVMESNSHGGDHTTSEELVTTPSAGQLANGYSSGEAAKETKPAGTWPTKATGKEAGGALQGAGAAQTKVKESKVDESVKTVSDIYVDRYFEDKLNFGKIKESMKSGLLG